MGTLNPIQKTITMVHFHLRREYKAGERRTPITPAGAKALIDAGHKVTVEKFEDRCFPDSAYEASGCNMVDGDSWRKADKDVYIIGLKELPENDDSPLIHTHIFFAHCFKYQAGWKELLKRFEKGGGKVLDLEFLTNDKGRRVAAFGRSAGFIGAAVGMMAWVKQQNSKEQLGGPLPYYDDYDALVTDVKQQIEKAGDKRPSVHVVGALGRCGGGAVDLSERVGASKVVKWDMAETAKGGPFKELLEVDVLINAILLNADNPPPPFVTLDMVDEESRQTTVLVDVSCDGTNPTNPVPLYSEGTSFFDPVNRVRDEASKGKKVFDVVAIDHLPSLVPSESSAEFAEALLPHLTALAPERTDVWGRAEKLFGDKVKEANESK